MALNGSSDSLPFFSVLMAAPILGLILCWTLALWRWTNRLSQHFQLHHYIGSRFLFWFFRQAHERYVWILTLSSLMTLIGATLCSLFVYRPSDLTNSQLTIWWLV